MKISINLGLVFLILLVLKLTGVVSWSWWIICIPLYFAGFGLLLIGAVFAYGGYLFASMIQELFKKRTH